MITDCVSHKCTRTDMTKKSIAKPQDKIGMEPPQMLTPKSNKKEHPHICLSAPNSVPANQKQIQNL